MGHYAKVLNGVVQTVIVADADFIASFVDTTPGEWIKTSYNTSGGVHYEPNSNPRVPSADQSKALRKNFAGPGWKYDSARDAFIPPNPPYESWVLNETTCLYEAPLPFPSLTDGQRAYWDESAHQADNTQGWVIVDANAGDGQDGS
jgi:hypothetical protein